MADAALAPLRRRFACKRYRSDRAIADRDLETVLEAGRLAPSSFGLEPWLFNVATDKAAIARLRAACLDQDAVGTAAAVIAITVRTAKHYAPDSPFIRARAERFPGGWPVFLADYESYWRFLKDANRLDAWARAQGYIAATAMMAAAAALDLDSCPIEGYDETSVLDAIVLDSGDWLLSLVLALGYRDEPARPRIREPLSALIRPVRANRNDSGDVT